MPCSALPWFFFSPLQSDRNLDEHGSPEPPHLPRKCQPYHCCCCPFNPVLPPSPLNSLNELLDCFSLFDCRPKLGAKSKNVVYSTLKVGCCESVYFNLLWLNGKDLEGEADNICWISDCLTILYTDYVTFVLLTALKVSSLLIWAPISAPCSQMITRPCRRRAASSWRVSPPALNALGVLTCCSSTIKNQAKNYSTVKSSQQQRTLSFAKLTSMLSILHCPKFLSHFIYIKKLYLDNTFNANESATQCFPR